MFVHYACLQVLQCPATAMTKSGGGGGFFSLLCSICESMKEKSSWQKRKKTCFVSGSLANTKSQGTPHDVNFVIKRNLLGDV